MNACDQGAALSEAPSFPWSALWKAPLLEKSATETQGSSCSNIATSAGEWVPSETTVNCFGRPACLRNERIDAICSGNVAWPEYEKTSSGIGVRGTTEHAITFGSEAR